MTLPCPAVGDPFPSGAADDEDCHEPGCRREPFHPAPHVAAFGGVVSRVWDHDAERDDDTCDRCGGAGPIGVGHFVERGFDGLCDGCVVATRKQAQR